MVVVSIGTRGPSVDWQDGGNPVREPPRGLEPIGDSGWYTSPDNLLPGDPLYCEYNSGSPVCGGNPFTNQGLGIDVEINVDPCGVSARFSGAIAFVKVPEVQTTYRLPGECRREYEKPPPLIDPPLSDGEGYDPPKAQVPQGFGADENVIVVFTFQYWSYEKIFSQRHQAWAEYNTVVTNTAGNPQYPSTYLYNGRNHNYGALKAATSSVHNSYNFVGTADPLYTELRGIPSANQSGEYELAIDSRQPNAENFQGQTLDYKRAHEPQGNSQASLYEGRFGSIFSLNWEDRYTGRERYTTTATGVDGNPYTAKVVTEIYQLVIAYVIRKPPDSRRNPPLLRENNKECCMQCCFSSPAQNNDDSCCKEVLAIVKRIEKNLGTYPGKVTIFDTNEDALGAQSKVIEFATVSQGLTRTIERVEKISKIIGIDLLPVTVPKNIVEPINDNFLEEVWDFLTPDATEKINNLFEWHVWNLKQMSTLIGHFQRYVEVEDKEETVTKPDGTQETKTKTKKIPLPDVATSLVESIKNQMVLHREVGLVLDVCMKILVSTCNTKQEVAKVYAEISEIVDFLDYPTNEESLEVPIQISIPPEGASDEEQQDFHKFLQPGKTMIKYNNWDGRNSFKDYMIHLATLIGRR